MSPGTRIRVVGGPWPERVGCTGHVVAPSGDGTYPQPSPWETLVLLDDDPFAYPGAWWTCVIRTSALEPLDGGGAA